MNATVRHGRMWKRTRGLSALLAAVTVQATASLAHASGHLPDGPLMLVALFWAMLPLIVPWAIALGTLIGRTSGLKFLFGFPASLLSILLCFHVPDDGTSLSSLFEVGGVFAVVAVVAHVVRFAVYVFARATGGRSKEVLKKWWRHL
jgi:hypothetical protein